jgi:hypothetical protein
VHTAASRPLNSSPRGFDGFLILVSATLVPVVNGMNVNVEASAMDLLYVGLTVVFFGVTWALVKLCERV